MSSLMSTLISMYARCPMWEEIVWKAPFSCRYRWHRVDVFSRETACPGGTCPSGNRTWRVRGWWAAALIDCSWSRTWRRCTAGNSGMRLSPTDDAASCSRRLRGDSWAFHETWTRASDTADARRLDVRSWSVGQLCAGWTKTGHGAKGSPSNAHKQRVTLANCTRLCGVNRLAKWSWKNGTSS